MHLPDRIERAGVLPGSGSLDGLWASTLVPGLHGFPIPPWRASLVRFLTGPLVGISPVTRRLPVTPHQAWTIVSSIGLLPPGATQSEDWPYPLAASVVVRRDPGGEFSATDGLGRETNPAATTLPRTPLGGAHG